MCDRPPAIEQVLQRGRWRARPARAYRATGERSPPDGWREALCKVLRAGCLMTYLGRALSAQTCLDCWDLEYSPNTLDHGAAQSWQTHDVDLRAQPRQDPSCDR